MVHEYLNVPVASKVRMIDVFALIPVMFAGAPVAASKKTLCPTDPNANVTACPTWVVRVAGLKLREGVALTLSATAGGLGLVGEAEPELPPPQHVAANNAKSRTVIKRPWLRWLHALRAIDLRTTMRGGGPGRLNARAPCRFLHHSSSRMIFPERRPCCRALCAAAALASGYVAATRTLRCSASTRSTRLTRSS